MVDSKQFSIADPVVKEFQVSVRDFFKSHACKSWQSVKTPPLLSKSCNQHNRIPHNDIAPDNELIHVGSLSALLKRAFKEQSAHIQKVILRLTKKVLTQESLNDASQLKAMVDALKNNNPNGVEELAGEMSTVLGSSEPHWWAVFAEDVDQLIADEKWSDAVNILGLGHILEGDWLLVWRYNVETAGPLYRPTVAEVGDNGFHFPSPPNEQFGITMPLDADLPAVKEIVHPPLKGELCRRACTGQVGKVVFSSNKSDTNRQSISNWLSERRKEHAEYLEKVYSNNYLVERWVKQHNL